MQERVDIPPLPETAPYWPPRETKAPTPEVPAAVTVVTGKAKKENPFLAFIERFHGDPVEFVRAVVGVEPEDWQADVLRDIAAGERRLAVKSGHGVGKSSVCAWAMVWFILTRHRCKIVVTAPTASQLFDALFAELKSTIQGLPEAIQELLEVTTDRVVLKAAPQDAFISARTASKERPEALQGVHSDHVLLIGDEASGIDEAVFEAAIGSMSGENATTLLTGNPTRTSGTFFKVFQELSDMWKCRTVSCLDSKLVTPDFIKDVIARYGEDSPEYQIRVLGEFPSDDSVSYLPFELVSSAVGRDVSAHPSAPVVWGLDVARYGNDKTALAKRQGNVVLEKVKVWRGLDLMQTVGMVKHEWDATPQAERPVEILVDSIGLGSGVLDRLRELELPARGINVAESTSMVEDCVRLRDELYFRARTWFAQRDCRLPVGDQPLVNDLTTVRYTYTSSGKLKIESKDEMKRRGVTSPDIGDAFILTFGSQAATAIHGRSYQAAKKRPVNARVRKILKGRRTYH